MQEDWTIQLRVLRHGYQSTPFSLTEQLHLRKIFVKVCHTTQSVNFKLIFVLCLWFPLCLCSAGASALEEPISLTLSLSWAVIHCRFCYNIIELNYQIASLVKTDFRIHCYSYACLHCQEHLTQLLVVWDWIRTRQDRKNKNRVW